MTVIGDVTMVTELQGGSGAYSTDNVVAVVVHCASSKKKKKKRSRSIILYILLLIQITVIPWGGKHRGIYLAQGLINDIHKVHEVRAPQVKGKYKVQKT